MRISFTADVAEMTTTSGRTIHACASALIMPRIVLLWHNLSNSNTLFFFLFFADFRFWIKKIYGGGGGGGQVSFRCNSNAAVDELVVCLIFVSFSSLFSGFSLSILDLFYSDAIKKKKKKWRGGGGLLKY